MGNKLVKIFIVVAILDFVLETCLGMLPPVAASLKANMLLPWRDMPTTPNGWVKVVLIALIFAWAFAYIFLQGYKGKGMGEGVRYGIWVWMLASIPANVAYSVALPEGRHIPLEFMAIDFITFVVCGVAAAAMAGSGTVASGAAA